VIDGAGEGSLNAVTGVEELRVAGFTHVETFEGGPLQGTQTYCAIHASACRLPGFRQVARRMNDDEFLTAFEARTLEEFHHRDYIKVAYLYLRQYSLHDAIAKVRTGLQALAVAWGAPVDDLEKGYHETMTQAWVRLVHLTLTDCGAAESADAFCDRQPQLMQKTRLELFYSRNRLMSWEAKRKFVAPDVARFA